MFDGLKSSFLCLIKYLEKLSLFDLKKTIFSVYTSRAQSL